MSITLLLVTRTHVPSTEGLAAFLSTRGGFARVALFSLTRGIEGLRTLWKDPAFETGSVAVVLADNEPGDLLESFEDLRSKAGLQSREIRFLFGYQTHPSYVRLLSDLVHDLFQVADSEVRQVPRRPEEIEAESFRIIDERLSGLLLDAGWHQVVRRAVHAVADFDMIEIMDRHPEAIEKGVKALRDGAPLLVDVQMVESGISRPYREKYGNSVFCHVGDADVAAEAGRTGETRSTLAMRKARR
jgi:Precorrin isomerase